MKFEEKWKKNKNCELSHMIRPAESPEVYKQKQNILFKVTWARLWVYSYKCTVEYLGRVHGAAVREAQLGYSFCTTRMGARLGWSWCTAWSGRVHGSVATHGLVAHGLNFMGMTEPCG